MRHHTSHCVPILKKKKRVIIIYLYCFLIVFIIIICITYLYFKKYSTSLLRVLYILIFSGLNIP